MWWEPWWREEGVTLGIGECWPQKRTPHTQEQLGLRSEAVGSGGKGRHQWAGPDWLRRDRQGERGKGRAFALPGGQSQQPLSGRTVSCP